jgi:hypothetical protein
METFCPRSTTAYSGYCPSGAKPRRKKKNNPESGTLSRLLTIFAVAFLLVDLVLSCSREVLGHHYFYKITDNNNK